MKKPESQVERLGDNHSFASAATWQGLPPTHQPQVRLSCPSCCHSARHLQLLTLSPRGFSTLGLREKCMCRLPSSLTLTDTFFNVLLPQLGQKTLVMSEVVLQDGDREGLPLSGQQNPKVFL